MLQNRRTLHHVIPNQTVCVFNETTCSLHTHHPLPFRPLDLLSYLRTDATCVCLHGSWYTIHCIMVVCTASPNLQKPPVTINGWSLDVLPDRVVPRRYYKPSRLPFDQASRLANCGCKLLCLRRRLPGQPIFLVHIFQATARGAAHICSKR